VTDKAIKSGTGYGREHWFDVIRDSGLGNSPHKQIADHLHAEHGLSFWWAQEVTVEFEYSIGRRVLGQTQDGLFQLGVSRTIDAPADRVWLTLDSAQGLALLLSVSPEQAADTINGLDRRIDGGIAVKTTTHVSGSHARLRWAEEDWQSHSILQVRVTPKPDGRSVLSFHHERLPSIEDRDSYRERWKAVAAKIESLVGNSGR